MSTTTYAAADAQMAAAADAAREDAAQQACREFARHYPSTNVQLAIRHAEAGDVTWQQIYKLFTNSLKTALTEVRREVTGR